MSASSPLEAGASGTARRVSGRVRRQLDTYQSSPVSNGKRKRTGTQDGQDDVEMLDDDESDEEHSSEDGEPDEEEIREQKARARKAKASAPKKPAQKKPRINGTSLAIRSVAGTRKRALKKGKAINTQDAEEAGGLFAKVFASDAHDYDAGLEAVASEWLRSFKAHESEALADVVAFVLQCAGCISGVTAHDIEDPDSVANRLVDVQQEYQATQPTDYPLIAKGKAGVTFKETMSGFLNALLKSIAADGILYENPLIMENLESWFSTMSSAGNRAFRHTATVASLTVITALCEISAERAKAAADSQRQADQERKKKNHNRGRAKDLDQRVQDATAAQEYLEVLLKDWFDTVFIHRYRDVDAAIRRDCIVALTDWAIILPEQFFDAQYLRYLGWVLSDTVAATRSEVVRQLQRLYNQEAGLGVPNTFTERFRPRLIEIATADAESTIRASGIELLDTLRRKDVLQADDIDSVGRLIYDSDPRVRKTVGPFFAACVAGLYESKVDDLGGADSLDESLADIGDDDFNSPRQEWLEFKSLAETMAAYDVEDDVPAHAERTREGGLVLHAAVSESRFTLAADALYSEIEAIRDWQSLSGYLLFDHSAGRANGVGNDMLSQLKHESVLTEHEEIILLDTVSASVKRAIIDLAEKGTSTKKKLTEEHRERLNEEQEDAARHLAELIPKLLKKFGDVPSTAAAVLRMESVFNLPSIRDLRQDTEAYGALLDGIKKQFLSHGTDEVLGPASEAILHAMSYGELDDLTGEKLGTLWEDVINNLTELINPATMAVRGTSNTEELVAISNNLLRITRLAQVSNCATALEDASISQSNRASDEETQGVIDYIITLIQRAMPSSGPAIDPQDAALEDQIAARAAEAALRYLQWKIQLILQTSTNSSLSEPSYDELVALATRRDNYVNNLDTNLQSRKPGEAISVNMAEYMLELHTSAVILKNIKPRPGTRDDWEVLIMDLHPSFLKLILSVFSAAEKNFATLGKKKLEIEEEEEDVLADPLDEDPISESEEEDEEEQTRALASQQRKENKLRKTVLAEKALCELSGKMIFAVHAGVDDGSMRKRLERNRSKLGPNYKELVAYMDVAGKNAKAKAKAKVKAKTGTKAAASKKGKANPKSNAIVAEDEVDDEIDDGGEDEGAVNDDRLVVEGDEGEDEDDV